MGWIKNDDGIFQVFTYRIFLRWRHIYGGSFNFQFCLDSDEVFPRMVPTLHCLALSNENDHSTSNIENNRQISTLTHIDLINSNPF